MARKKCTKKDFPITTCKTRHVSRCEGWVPKAPKPRKPRTKKAITDEQFKEASRHKQTKFVHTPYVRPTIDAETEKKLWIYYELRKQPDGSIARGPTEKTRFPPSRYKQLPHKWKILQEGVEGR